MTLRPRHITGAHRASQNAEGVWHIEFRISSGVRATVFIGASCVPQESVCVGVDRGSDGAWSIEPVSRLAGGGSAGWKLRRFPCRMRCGTGCNEERRLDTPGPLPVLLREHSQRPRGGPPTTATAACERRLTHDTSTYRTRTSIRSHAPLTPDPLRASLDSGLSYWHWSDPCREAEAMDLTMPGCFRRGWRTARSESADPRLTRGGHGC
jgi:hypothetical protein